MLLSHSGETTATLRLSKNKCMFIVDEIEVGKGEALFLLLIMVPLSTANLSCDINLVEINILVHKLINFHCFSCLSSATAFENEPVNRYPGNHLNCY